MGDPGTLEREIRVDLSTNDHRDYALHGVTISDSFIIHVSEEEASGGDDHEHGEEEEHHDDEEEHHDDE